MSGWIAERTARETKGILTGAAGIPVSGCVLDSRKARGGEMFFALPGEHADGFDFIENAWKNGAALAIAAESRFAQSERKPLPPEGKALLLVASVENALQKLAGAWRGEIGAKVIGVTGSNGKTTTKDMTAAVLAQSYRVYRSEENHNNELGLPLTILNAPAQTEVLVLEMGMRGLGQIAALCETARPDVGIITNIGTAHLELLLTQERIAQAKWELIESLPADGTGIINGEDCFSAGKAKQDSGRSFCFYGLEGKYERPELRGWNLRPWGSFGTEFEVSRGEESAVANLPLPGEHNVLNALAALAAGRVLGVSLEEGCRGLSALELSKMRLEVRKGLMDSTLINDVYNANPASVRASLRVLKERAGKNKTAAVLGDMYELGDSRETEHIQLGAFLAGLEIDYLITVGELAEKIAWGARKAGYPETLLVVTGSLEEAALRAREFLTACAPGTWVLLKGSRGMKMEEITTRLE